MDTQIHLNMKSVSAQLKTNGKAIIDIRKDIGSRMDQVGRWLSSCKEMLDKFKESNRNRIEELGGMIHGSDLTISVQKLIELSISKEQDLGVLKDSVAERAQVNHFLQELKSLQEQTKYGWTANQLSLTPLDYARERLYSSNKYFNNSQLAQWPAIFLASLAAKPLFPEGPTSRAVKFSPYIKIKFNSQKLSEFFFHAGRYSIISVQ